MVTRLNWKLESNLFLTPKKIVFCVEILFLVKMTILSFLEQKIEFLKMMVVFSERYETNFKRSTEVEEMSFSGNWIQNRIGAQNKLNSTLSQMSGHEIKTPHHHSSLLFHHLPYPPLIIHFLLFLTNQTLTFHTLNYSTKQPSSTPIITSTTFIKNHNFSSNV